LAAPSHLRVLYLTHLSKPASDRSIYRFLRQQRIASILEIGLGMAERSLRMIELAGLHVPAAEIRYVGVDSFEARSAADEPGLTLKEAHRTLKATGARVQLLPGDPLAAIGRAANSLHDLDLVLVSAAALSGMEQAWFYLPRMLHAGSNVFVEQLAGRESEFRPLDSAEIARLSSATRRRRAA
jgi:hypothetical protein